MIPIQEPPKSPITSVAKLGYLSTEKSNQSTTNLSQVMHANTVDGLKILHQEDQKVIEGLEQFNKKYYWPVRLLVQQKLLSGGRCFLTGSGSSARVAIDIAAKSKNPAVIGVMAGGDSIFMRAKEGFEDSEKDGDLALQDYNITKKDLVFLISASGSASFNIGCAKYARQKGADVCYFYNSTEIPANTQELFDKHRVMPLLIDIGAQTISGSTRLQSATLAELALGSVVLNQEPDSLTPKLQTGNKIIQEHLQEIAQIVQLEHEVFSDPQANFRKIKDETSQGYVTFVATENALRECMIDTAETAPTFSTNPPRTKNDTHKKKTEFLAFLAGQDDNNAAWRSLLGREINAQDMNEVEQFTISQTALANRPLAKGNLVIGVAKENPESLFPILSQAKNNGAKTALIILSQHEISTKDIPHVDALLTLPNIESDAAEIVTTVVLKQVLNMISNGSMILMNKVDGNQMIDVNASNNKLLDRAARLVLDIFKRYQKDDTPDYDSVFKTIIAVKELKKECEAKNMYTPSPVKITVTMMKRNLNFEHAVAFLHEHEEHIEQVFA